MKLENLEGWFPADVVSREEGLRVAWTLRNRDPLLESSIEKILQRQMAKPFHQLFRRETSPEAMAACVEEHPPAPLRGMIFHTSRCGSRALAGDLASNGKNRVATQPTPLDSLLRVACTDLPRATQVRWLRAMVGALGQPQEDEEAFFLLLHPWHIHSIDLFREAFPETPWIFLYDEPAAWLESMLRNPPMWTIPALLAPEALHLKWSDWQPPHPEIYPARALAAMYWAALEAVQAGSQGLLINRSMQAETMYPRAAKQFGVDVNQTPPSQKTGGSGSESSETSARLRDVVDEHMQGLYEELEAQRNR